MWADGQCCSDTNARSARDVGGRRYSALGSAQFEARIALSKERLNTMSVHESEKNKSEKGEEK
jgi:hypothetical protein